jgi:hypothetical protein
MLATITWNRRALACLGQVSAFALCLLPVTARAHSLPYGVALAWAEPDASALPVIVANRGLVFANGASAAEGFSIRCNEAYNANTSDRPLAHLEASGRLTVGVYNQVFQTSDRGCSSTPSSGLPVSQFSSVLRSASSPKTLYTLMRDVKQAGVFASEDFGQTFEQRFANKTDEYYESMVVAPSDAQRLYAAGIAFDRVNQKVTFYASRSLDGGRNWENTVTDARITPLAVHPTNPDVLFAYRAIDKLETTFDVLRSDDRGKSYRVVLANTYLPTGFAVVAGVFYLGASFRGAFYQSRDDGQSFTPLLTDQIQRITCLAEHAGKLWMCANIAPNLDAIWILKDDASGVDKVMSFDAVTAPVACSSAAASAQCETAWLDFTREVHVTDDAGMSDAGLPDEDAGAAPADAASAPEADDTGSEPSDESDADEPAAPTARGGRCQFALPARMDLAAHALTLLLALLAYRRRRA